MPNLITEDQIEQALLGRLSALGWATLNCNTADPAHLADGSGRAEKRDVILRSPLRKPRKQMRYPSRGAERSRDTLPTSFYTSTIRGAHRP